MIAGVLGLLGCAGDPVEIGGLKAEVSDGVPTVVTVRWTTASPSVGFVAYGEDGAFDRATALEPRAATRHEAVLVGLPADTPIDWRVVVGDSTSDDQQIRTGFLPAVLPAVDRVGDGHDGFMAVPVLGATTAALLLDAQGRIVWYHVDERGLDVYRVRVAQDGRGVIYNAASVSGDPADDSVLVRVAWDGTEEEVIEVPLLAHDFVEHPDGTLAAIATEYRDFEGAPLRGDKLVEIAPDGTQTVVFTSWDCWDPAATTHAEMEHGWTFANALDLDDDGQSYTLSLRNFSSIVRIDRATGDCVWGVGGLAATLTLAPGSSGFLHQHQFDVLDDGGLLVFDNDGLPGSESRVVEYALDHDAGQATEVWSYRTDPSIFSFVLGDVSRLGGGDTLVTWSVAGQIERVAPAGDVIWRLNTELGYAFGFTTVLEALHAEN